MLDLLHFGLFTLAHPRLWMGFPLETLSLRQLGDYIQRCVSYVVVLASLFRSIVHRRSRSLVDDSLPYDCVHGST